MAALVAKSLAPKPQIWHGQRTAITATHRCPKVQYVDLSSIGRQNLSRKQWDLTWLNHIIYRYWYIRIHVDITGICRDIYIYIGSKRQQWWPMGYGIINNDETSKGSSL
jgi:hypothetical protein